MLVMNDTCGLTSNVVTLKVGVISLASTLASLWTKDTGLEAVWSTCTPAFHMSDLTPDAGELFSFWRRWDKRIDYKRNSWCCL